MYVAKDSSGASGSSNFITLLANELWFSQVLSLAAKEPQIYKTHAIKLILSQDPKAKHSLAEKLFLIVGLLSMKNIANWGTLRTQETF